MQKLRQEGNHTPLILLTALNGIDDKVEGFEAGADDYLTKPFDFQELMLRIKALARRKKDKIAQESWLNCYDVSVNLDSKEVSRKEVKINLTPREFDLLVYLMKFPGKVISKQEIIEKAWHLNWETSINTVEVYVNFLRKKLENGFDTKLIHTQFKTGYIFKQEA